MYPENGSIVYTRNKTQFNFRILQTVWSRGLGTNCWLFINSVCISCVIVYFGCYTSKVWHGGFDQFLNEHAWCEYMGYILWLCMPPASGSWPKQRELHTWTYDLQIPASQRSSTDNITPIRFVHRHKSMGLQVNPVRGLELETVHHGRFGCAFMRLVNND
jgi:hypothetical protein